MSTHEDSMLVSWGFTKPTTQLCYSVHVLLAPNGFLEVRLPGAPGCACVAVLTPAAVLHQIHVSGRHLLIGCVDPASNLGRALRHYLGDRIVPLDDSVIVRFGAALPWLRGATREAVDGWIRSTMTHARVEQQVHPGVRSALEYVHRHAVDTAHISLARLAQVADLSPSRLMHVFTDSVGVPLRPYLSWLRLQRAIEAFGDGHSVTDAAYLAGFADGPHLARTLRRILGTTPRALIGHDGCEWPPAATAGSRTDAPDATRRAS